ncbi:MAG: hypothetical protein R3B94_05730 [Hyphomonas sp.]
MAGRDTETIAASGEGVRPGICVELGRATIPADLRPDAGAVDRASTAARFAGRRVA